jgi:hypothetical protein
MWRDTTVAVVASALASGLAFSYRRYGFWRGWNRRRFWGGYALYLSANAAMGATAVGLASLVEWEPFPGKWLANGFTYAAAGQSLLRIEPRGFGLDKANEARSLIARGIDFVVDMLNGSAEEKVQERLDNIQDGQLLALALYLQSHYVEGDRQLPRETKDMFKQVITEAGERLEGHLHQAEGRGTLERFCLRQIVDRELLPRAAKSDLSPSRPDAPHTPPQAA